MPNSMHPRIILGTAAADGHQAIPQTVGAVEIWTARFPMTIGPWAAFEYRNASDDLFVVKRVAGLSGGRVASIIYVPVPQGGDDVADLRGLRAALVAGGTILRSWPMAAGARLIAALEADGGALATTLKTGWPAAWKQRLATDYPATFGDPLPPPTGPRILGDVLA